MKQYRIDEEIKQINLFDERWYEIQTEGGEVILPSVTTYLEAYPKGLGYEKWLMNNKDPYALRDEAGQLGSYVHGLIEQTLLENTVKFEEGITKIEAWERYLYWCTFWKNLNENPSKTLKIEGIKEIVTKKDFTEFITYNLEESYAGTVDKLIRLNFEDRSIYAIVDWKTGSNIFDTAYLQVSAYAKSTAQQFKIPVEMAIIVHLNPSLNKIGYRIHIRDKNQIETDFEDFTHVKKIWLREHIGEKPKYKIYPMELNLEKIKNEPIIKEK